MKNSLVLYLEKEMQKIYNKYNIKLNPINYNLKERVLIANHNLYTMSTDTLDVSNLESIIDSIEDKFPKNSGYFYNLSCLEPVYDINYTGHYNNDGCVNGTNINLIAHNNILINVEKLIYDTLEKPYDIEKELREPFKKFPDEVYKYFENYAQYYLIPIILAKTETSLIDTLYYLFVKDYNTLSALDLKNMES